MKLAAVAKPTPTRLNVGCGGRRLPGYTGVDAVPRPAADIVAPAHKIPLADASIDEIMAIHLFEHFPRWECDGVIAEWRRLLRPGGVLTLELPNLQKCCENILSGRMEGGKHPDQLSYWGIFGDPRQGDDWMSHRWGWTPESMKAFLAEHGFVKIREEQTQHHPAGREHRDMRITARRA